MYRLQIANALHSARTWIARWRELFLLPLLLLSVLVAYYVIPAVDPRAGIDGGGALFDMAVTAVGVLLSSFVAWWCVDTYFVDIRDTDERELIDHACGIDRARDTGQRIGHGPQSWPAVVIYIWNQLLWLAIFALLLSRFVP